MPSQAETLHPSKSLYMIMFMFEGGVRSKKEGFGSYKCNWSSLESLQAYVAKAQCMGHLR